jgi:hypothetical protein
MEEEATGAVLVGPMMPLNSLMPDKIRSLFATLPANKQIPILTLLGLATTLCAREVFGQDPGKHQAAYNKLRCFNELHFLINHRLLRIQAGSGQLFARDVFLDLVFREAKSGGCKRELLWALDQSLQQEASLELSRCSA